MWVKPVSIVRLLRNNAMKYDRKTPKGQVPGKHAKHDKGPLVT